MNILKWTVSGLIAVAPLGLLTGCHEHRHEVVVHEERPVVVEREPAQVIVVPEPPPPIIVEKVPHGPRGQIWIAGHYDYYDHHYVWRPGHHEAPPHKGARWEPDRWDRTEHGYEHRAGHWK